MSYTRIRNPNVRANAVLPSPFTGAIEAGGSVVLPFSSAQILAVCPSITRSFELTDLPAGSEGSSNDVSTHGPLGYNGYTLEGDIDAGGGFRSGYSFAKTSIAAGDNATTASSTAVPAAVPAAPVAPVASGGAAGPNLAAYALAAGNAPGQSVYERSGLRLTSPEKACAKFTSSDLAQMAFLEKGGPAKDPLNLDPDGDGFACGWDPRPFQAARP